MELIIPIITFILGVIISRYIERYYKISFEKRLKESRENMKKEMENINARDRDRRRQLRVPSIIDDATRKGFANFYKDETCLYSIACQTIKEAEKLADRTYINSPGINDWSYTKDPVGPPYRMYESKDLL